MWRSWGTPHIYWWTLKNPKNQNFEKTKKKKNCWRHHHFTHVYQKPQSYEVQFLRYKEWKNENFKKNKKVSGVPSFYTGVPKIIIRWCTVSEIWCMTDRWTGRQTEKVTYRGECGPKNFCLINIQLST